MLAWRTWRRGAVVTLAVWLLTTCALPAAAQTLPCTKTFALETNGNWHVDENWIPFGVPGPSDIACILGSGGFRVTVDLPVTVAGLEVSGPNISPWLVVEAMTALTLNGPGLMDGTALLKMEDGSELLTDGGGVIEVRSRLKVEDSTISVDVELYGELKVEGASYLTANLATYPGSVVLFEGTAGGWLTVANGFEHSGEIAFNQIGTQGVTVVSGTLAIAVDGLISTKVVNGPVGTTPELHAEIINSGVIDVDGVDLLIASDGAGHVSQAGGTIDVAGAELTIDLNGLTEAASNFTNYGSMTVATGGTIRVGGTTRLTEAASNFTNYGSMTVATGGTIRVGGTTREQIGVAFINHGMLTIDDGGLVEVNGADFENLLDGTVAGEGELDVAMAAGVVFDGTLDPGQPTGIFTLDGSLDPGPSAQLLIDVAGQTPGIDLDRVDIGGAFAPRGTLDVSLLPPHEPAPGNRYQILTFGSVDGWFDSVLLPPLPNLLVWAVDVGTTEVALDVICQGTQLALAAEPDRNPVSLSYGFVIAATVDNLSSMPASEVVVRSDLPAGSIFRADLSSPGCAQIGLMVECPITGLAPGAQSSVEVGLEPVIAGPLNTTLTVGSWECDTLPADNTAIASVDVVAAAPCDANFDLAIDSDDLVPAAEHIFGTDAVGNPDCRVGDGITADDLAAIIEQGFVD